MTHGNSSKLILCFWPIFTDSQNNVSIQTLQGRRKSPTTPTLSGPKISSFLVKILYIQKFGRTNNCLVEVFLKWSNQPCTPSATPFLNIQLNINQIKCFMDQSLSWLIVDQKQFQFRKSKILFACYAPLNS